MSSEAFLSSRSTASDLVGFRFLDLTTRGNLRERLGRYVRERHVDFFGILILSHCLTPGSWDRIRPSVVQHPLELHVRGIEDFLVFGNDITCEEVLQHGDA